MVVKVLVRSQCTIIISINMTMVKKIGGFLPKEDTGETRTWLLVLSVVYIVPLNSVSLSLPSFHQTSCMYEVREKYVLNRFPIFLYFIFSLGNWEIRDRNWKTMVGIMVFL